MTDENTILWNLYAENWTQVRHQTQRSTMSSLVVVVSGAIITLVTADKCVNIYDLPLAFLLVVLGVFGWFFSAKQYERSQLHVERVRGYRAMLDQALPNARIVASKLEADETIRAKFPKMHLERASIAWQALHGMLVLLGIALIVFSLLKGDTPCEKQAGETCSPAAVTSSLDTARSGMR